MKFTDTMIKNLKPDEGKKKYVREANGFAICVYPTGVKSWFFIYTMDSKRHSMALGSYPDITLTKAREKYNAAWKLYIDGKDPAKIDADTKEERRKAPTMKDLCEDYIKKHAMKFKRSWKEDERILNKEVIPTWGNRKATDIVKRDILQMLECILDRGSPGQANNSFQVIRKMFNFAVERDILAFSPCTGLKLPAPKKSRDRVLSGTEIKTFWDSLPTCAMSDELRNALMLILITAQRPGEVIQIRTDEIEGNWWTIPAERAKNGKTHRVPLSAMAVEIIQQSIDHIKTARELPADFEYSGLIFPCPHLKKIKSIERHALAVATLRNLAWPITDENNKPVLGEDGKPVTENRFGIDHFTPHDLRRTAATFLAKSGEMDEVIDAVLNHAKQGVIKVYNQYRYDKEKQIALESWARKLITITTGTQGKVIPMLKASGGN